MINPEAIPLIPGDMGALTGHATALSAVGTEFPATGGRVDTTWQGLASIYHAPEAGTLLTATAPVRAVSASVGEDVAAVGTALASYATEVSAIQTRLVILKSQAAAFVQSVAGDDDWRKSQSKVDEHNGLIAGVDAAVADFQDAQRRCANAILARYSTKRWTAENGDGTVTDSEYGYTAAQLDSAMGQKDALPWGTSEEHDRGFWGDVGAGLKGFFWDGPKGFVLGLAGLIGRGPDGSWSWGNAGEAWKGLGTFAIAIGAYTTPFGPMLDQTVGYPGFERGQLGDTLLGAGKAIIAYDEWGKDKSHAAGMAGFNIISAIVGTKGAGASLRAGGAALEGTEIAGVARLGTATLRVGEAIGKIPTVSDVLKGALTRFPGFRLPHIDIPEGNLPTTHVDVPHAPHVETPPHVGTHGPSVGDGLPRTPHVDTPSAHAPTPHVAPHSHDLATPHSDAGGPHHPADTPASPADHGPPDAGPAGDPAPGPHPGEAAPPPVVPPHLGPLDVPPSDVPPPLHREDPLPTQDLRPGFHGEADPHDPHRWSYPDTVEYMSPAELEKHRVTVIDGRLHWSNGQVLNTVEARTLHGGGGRAMFVMDRDGNLYVSLEQRLHVLHHSSFLSGDPVAGAGELVVKDGIPEIMSRKSGHYQPTAEQQQAVVDMLTEQGLDLSGVRLESGF